MKSLEGENNSLSNEIQGLRRFIHDDKLSRMQNKQVNGQLEDKYNSTYHQLRAVDHDKQDLRGQLQAKGKELTALTQKYDLLSKEFSFECEAHRKETRDLSRELESCQK